MSPSRQVVAEAEPGELLRGVGDGLAARWVLGKPHAQCLGDGRLDGGVVDRSREAELLLEALRDRGCEVRLGFPAPASRARRRSLRALEEITIVPTAQRPCSSHGSVLGADGQLHYAACGESPEQ
ncbi:hypothetical protein DNK56_15335 [Streptomyces sp. AC1-42W]|nr:hypothetical protein DNK55_16090 [Streptomyces sp. AC1-42T]PZT83252.1 hypothetical protein DNK56_15335 [Streptomyces sp. AC1-42W]